MSLAIVLFHVTMLKSPNASVNSKHQYPLPGQTPGKYFSGNQSSASGKNFSAEVQTPGKTVPISREYFGRFSKPCLLIGYEISEFYRNQTLKKLGCPSNYYSLVVPSSLHESTILDHLE